MGHKKILLAGLPVLVATAIAFSTTPAAAQAPPRADRTTGTILAVDGERLIVDLGAEDGVAAGSRLTVLHVVVATDPLTGETLRDRFPIGTIEVERAGARVCAAQAPAALVARIAVGDQVAPETRRRLVDPWQERLETARRAALAALSTTGAAPLDRRRAREAAEARVAAAEQVRTVWEQTLGKAPAQRIELWTTLLAAHPENPHADAIRAEIARLREQAEAHAALIAERADPAVRRAEKRAMRLAALDRRVDPVASLAVRLPPRAPAGQPLALAFTVIDPRVERAWVYVRTRDEDSFQRLPAAMSGDQYARATIPASAMAAPGVELFVEVQRAADPAPTAALGTQDAPLRVAVDAPDRDAPDTADRSRVTLLVDYVDFDGNLGSGFDQYYQAELDFMYRFRWPVYAVRVGFGTMSGTGGPKDVIDADPTGQCLDATGTYRCRRVDYAYAYTELEYRFSEVIAIMLRPQFGHGTSDERADASRGRCDEDDLSDCEIFRSLGLRARVRLGAEQETNLVLGVGATESVGTLFEAAYTWRVIRDFPVLLSAQVTDQPVPEDFGVRLIADVGWRKLGWVYPSVRVSYQARDVDHAGLSGGLAANFDW